MRAHVFLHPSGGAPRTDVPAESSVLPLEPERAAAEIERVLADPGVDVLVFWDPALGEVPLERAAELLASRDDAWHASSALRSSLEPDLLRYVQPLWTYRCDPPAEIDGAVSPWLDLRCLLVRADVPRRLGGLEGGFRSLEGAAREMGVRWLQRGAICRQRAAGLGVRQAKPSPKPALSDAYRFVYLHYGRRWASYALARRLAAGVTPWRELRAHREALAAGPSRIQQAPVGALLRDVEAVEIPRAPTVTVVLPTFGRYRYVAEVLEDIRQQTVRPTQIVVADGNPPEERQPEVYARFSDLPLEVLWPERGGTCIPRNACLERASGEYIWFVDDDSRLEPRNLEMHLRVLAAYGADVSVGPAYTPRRPELPANQREVMCTFMDCGTTLCHRGILARSGGFDVQLNDHLPGEDAEIGLRFVRSGGLMLNNPLAKRFHYLAPVGGARTSGNNIHRWRRFSMKPRPAESVYYLAKRHFGKGTAGAAMFQTWMLAGLRAPEGGGATRGWWLRTIAAELVALPISAARLVRSVHRGRALIRTGPQVPRIRQ